MTRFKGYRTIILNTLAGVLLLFGEVGPILAEILGAPEVQALIPDTYMRWVSLGIVLLNIYLRTVTTTPIGRKE